MGRIINYDVYRDIFVNYHVEYDWYCKEKGLIEWHVYTIDMWFFCKV